MSFAEQWLIDRSEVCNDRVPVAAPLTRDLTVWYLASSLLLIAVTSGILYWAALEALYWADDQVASKRMEAVRSLLQDEFPNDALIAHEVSEDNQGPRQIFIRVITSAEALRMETPDMPPALAPSRFPAASAAPELTFDPDHSVAAGQITSGPGSGHRL